MLSTVLALTGLPVARADDPLPVYRDTHYSFAERAADLVSRMTLDEKAGQLSTTNAPAIARLGVQSYAYWSEAQHGVNKFMGGDWHGLQPTGGIATPVPATAFPTNLSASLTWDPALMARETAVISDEARGFLDKSLFGRAYNNLGPDPGQYGSLFYWAPTVNLDRDPRWGRTDEAFGEDPFLVGTMASAWVDGFQGQKADGRLKGRYLKAVATEKHFALNNVEHERMGISSDTDERTIRDYYTAQFRRVVEQAHVAGLMSSYNAINGVPAPADNFTLNVLLRRTWGFDGYVTSDCGAVGALYRKPDLTGQAAAQSNGTAVLARSGHNWAPPGWTTDGGNDIARWTNTATGRSISGQAGAEAYSLRAGTTLNCVGAGDPKHPFYWDLVRPLLGFESRADYIHEAIAAGVLTEDVIDRGLVRVFTQRMRTGEFDPVAGQPYTRITKDAIQAPAHARLAQQVGEAAMTLLQNRPAGAAGRPLLPVDPSATKKVVLLGDQAGKVTLGGYSGNPTEQVSLEQGMRRELPGAQITFDAAGTSSTATQAPTLSQATQGAIRAADLVVVMAGTDPGSNAEGADRHTMAMPGNYAQLVQRVAALGNPRIALVVQSAGAVGLEQVKDHVASILFSGHNGQRQGIVAARALLGRVNPSGHLSFTWYRGDEQLPDIQDYDLTPAKTGGLGRTYQYFTGSPTYPFGFGLSYTTFLLSGMNVSSRRVDATGTEHATVRVTNTGSRAGATVVQIYATPPARRGLQQPMRKLVGFRKTRLLAPGARQTLRIAIPLIPNLRMWDPQTQRSVVYRGRWRFAIARSAQDAARTFAVRITGRIPRTIKTVTIEPDQLTLKPGQAIDLLGSADSYKGLPPTGLRDAGDQIVTAVRADDTFAPLSALHPAFSSDHAEVARVDAVGRLTAVAPGVTTIRVRIGHARASTPIVVTG